VERQRIHRERQRGRSLSKGFRTVGAIADVSTPWPFCWDSSTKATMDKPLPIRVTTAAKVHPFPPEEEVTKKFLERARTNKETGREEYDVVLAVSFTFVRDGAVVDEAERGPGRTSEWEGSRPANPPGVAAGLLFRWG